MRVGKVMMGGVLGCACWVSASHAQDWSLIRPSNTGIPGEEVRTVDFAPDGTIWVGARWPFWGEGGIGVLDRTTQVWSGWSNAPIDGQQARLPTPMIHEIEFAPDGTPWLATEIGLVYFDGNEWQRFHAGNSPMAFNRVGELSIAPDGTVWINNSDPRRGGDAILSYDGTTWTRYRPGIEMPWDTVFTDLSDVFVSSNGHVWVGNETLRGLAEFDGQTWRLHDDPNKLIIVEGFVEDALGRIWMHGNPSTNTNGGLYMWNGEGFTRMPMSTVLDLAVDPDSGYIYAGNFDGMVIRSTNNGASFTLFAEGLNPVFNLAPDPAGDEILIGTPGAVGRFSDSGQLLEDWNSYNTGMPFYLLDDLKISHANGKIIMASEEGGVSVFDGQRWDNVGIHNRNFDWPVGFPGADAVMEDRAGNIWIGTNGVARWDRVNGTFTLWDFHNSPFGTTFFNHLIEMSDGDILAFGLDVGEMGKVWRLDAQTLQWTQEYEGPFVRPGGHSGAVIDSQGTVWFSGSVDLVRYDGTTFEVVQQPFDGFLLGLGGIWSLAVGPDDAIWIGTGDGVVRYDGTNWTVFDAGNTPMIVDRVTGIDFRDDGVMALALSDQDMRPDSGMAIVDGDPANPASWSVYTARNDPIPFWQINDVAFDANGDVWLSCVGEAVAVLHIGDAGCAADLTGDGVADSNDFFAYLDLFAAGDPAADITGNGTIDADDFFAYLDLFAAGC